MDAVVGRAPAFEEAWWWRRRRHGLERHRRVPFLRTQRCAGGLHEAASLPWLRVDLALPLLLAEDRVKHEAGAALCGSAEGCAPRHGVALVATHCKDVVAGAVMV